MTGATIWQGVLGAFVMSGVDIIDIDLNNEVLTIIIPKDSYEWHQDRSAIKNADDYARRIKGTWHGLGIFKNGKVRYKTKDVYWTEEMSERAWEENKDKIFNTFGGLV